MVPSGGNSMLRSRGGGVGNYQVETADLENLHLSLRDEGDKSSSLTPRWRCQVFIFHSEMKPSSFLSRWRFEPFILYFEMKIWTLHLPSRDERSIVFLRIYFISRWRLPAFIFHLEMKTSNLHLSFRDEDFPPSFFISRWRMKIPNLHLEIRDEDSTYSKSNLEA